MKVLDTRDLRVVLLVLGGGGALVVVVAGAVSLAPGRLRPALAT